jgi:hypothetical protein
MQYKGWSGWRYPGHDFSALLVAVSADAESAGLAATLICSLGSTAALHVENPA